MKMKRLAATLTLLFFTLPSVSFAAALTSQQSSSLIAVVQSSPGTPASAFVSLITAFSNITVNQATNLITVVQDAPGVAASAFVNLLTSFTDDSTTTQPVTPVPAVTVPPTQTTQPTPTPTAPPASQSTIPASTVSTTQPNSPSVTILADGSTGPITEPLNGPAVTISWNSQNVLACGITGAPGWSGNFGTSGSKIASFSAPSTTVTIQCSALVNNVVTPNAVSDSVVINVPGSTTGVASASESLSVDQGLSDPPSDNILAGQVQAHVGEFTFTATGSSYTIQKVTILVPSNVATSVNQIYVSGMSERSGGIVSSGPLVPIPGSEYSSVTLTGLDVYVPANEYANIEVYAWIASTAVPGTAIQVTLDTGANTNSFTFKAIDVAGSPITQINGGLPITAKGIHTVSNNN